jgi:hypothetical protein
VQKPFIFFEPLKTWEIVVAVIYAFFTFSVCLCYGLGTPDAKQMTLMAYTVLLQLFMYFFLCVSLRNFTSYLIWCGFGMVQIIMYFVFRGNPDLQMPRGDPSTGLLNTIVLLILFQFLRYFSRQIQNREFVAPSRGRIDLLENKKITLTDYIIFVIYMGAWGGLTALEVSK